MTNRLPMSETRPPAEELLLEPEEMPYIDTMSNQLDRALQLIQGTEAWFDANPDYDHFTFTPDVTGDGKHCDEYVFTVTRDTLHTLKGIAVTRFTDLKEHSELGYAVAQDVVTSWQPPTHDHDHE